MKRYLLFGLFLALTVLASELGTPFTEISMGGNTANDIVISTDSSTSDSALTTAGYVAANSGLTLVADDTVTGGAVTILSSGTFSPALADGDRGEIWTYITQDGTGNPNHGLAIDGETADTNYGKNGLMTSTGTHSQGSTRITSSAGETGAASDKTYARYSFVVTGTEIALIGATLATDGSYHRTMAIRFDNGSIPTSIDVVSSVASKIGNGSQIAIYRTTQ